MDQAKLHLERSLMSPSRRVDRIGWEYYLLGYIASALNDTASLRRAVEGAEAADAVIGGWSGWATATRALLQAAVKH